MDEPEKRPVPLDEGVVRAVILVCIVISILGVIFSCQGTDVSP